MNCNEMNVAGQIALRLQATVFLRNIYRAIVVVVDKCGAEVLRLHFKVADVCECLCCRWHELECFRMGQSSGGAHMGEGNFACPTLHILNTWNVQRFQPLRSFQMLGLDGSLVFLVNFFLSAIFNLIYFAFVLTCSCLFCRNMFFGWCRSTRSSFWSLVSRKCQNKFWSLSKFIRASP